MTCVFELVARRCNGFKLLITLRMICVGDAFAIEDGGVREDDMGLHEDQYHGWCRDDVA